MGNTAHDSHSHSQPGGEIAIRCAWVVKRAGCDGVVLELELKFDVISWLGVDSVGGVD